MNNSVEVPKPVTSATPLPIIHTFTSFQGEGAYTGTPAFFIRIARCNLKCSFCDTDLSLPRYVRLGDLLNKIETHAPRHIVITGGEPLLFPEEVDWLVAHISAMTTGEVEIETNGTRPFLVFRGRRLLYTISPKNTKVPNGLPTNAVLKFLVGKELPDYEEIIHAWIKIRGQNPLFFQPITTRHKMPADNIDLAISLATRYNGRLSLQTHKLVGWS